MAAPKPTHAYVEYKDGDKAIVAVSLIKRYSPNGVTELANNKLVCWRKSRKGYVSEGYIRGDVLTLGYGIDHLVARMLKQGKLVPKKVLEESGQGIRLEKSALQGAKQRRQHSKVPKKPATSKILGKRRRNDLDSETDEEEEVPRRLLQEAEDKIAELEERLRVSEERLREERQQNIKLENLLEQKMDSMEASIIAAIKSERHGAWFASQDSQQEARAVRRKKPPALHKDWGAINPRKETPVAADPQPSQPSSVLPPREEQAGSQEAIAAPSSPGSPNIDEPEQTQPETDTDAPLFKPVNGKVHIGKGLFIPSEMWASLKESNTDGTFARGLMRCLWKREELVNRSVTGTVCRRLIYHGGKAKPGLSPKKRDAMQMAYYHFVKTHPTTLQTTDRRLRNLNRHLGYFLRGLR